MVDMAPKCVKRNATDWRWPRRGRSRGVGDVERLPITIALCLFAPEIKRELAAHYARLAARRPQAPKDEILLSNA